MVISGCLKIKHMSKKYEFVKEEFKEEVKELDTKLDRIKAAKVDLTAEYKMPTFIIKLKAGNIWTNIGTLGNFICITGAAKARKSFARFFFEAAALKNGLLYGKFYVNLPENKKRIVYVDTEQGKSNVNFAAKRICKMANVGNNPNNYDVYSLRQFTHIERCEIIEDIIKQNNDIGIMFIDGVADLASCNNDEIEGNRVTQLLMTWTAKYNINIITVIHQPRSHNGATGHLGSQVEKKAESIISVKKDGSYSIIESQMLRNSDDFAPFPFIINSEYMPELINEETEEVEDIKENYNVNAGIEPEQKSFLDFDEEEAPF